MLSRAFAVRLVLVTAALTTVATSAPPEIRLSDTTDGRIGPAPTQIRVLGNRAAVNHADAVHLFFSQPPGAADGTADEWPDRGLPIKLRSTATAVAYAIDDVCVRDRDCDASFTVEVDSDMAIDVGITATFERTSDSSFFFPDNPPFPDAATVEVRIEP